MNAAAQLALALGHARAKDAADHAGESWQTAALNAFRAFARENTSFTTAEVSAWASDLTEPPDRRAWGHVARQAREAAFVMPDGLVRSLNPRTHGMYVTRWRSLILRTPS